MMASQTIGVLLAQLGSPDAPTAEAVRPYLKQFLSDRRVIDYHPLVWQMLLRGIILRVRPAKSAKLYQRVWLDDGSPLTVYSKAQVSGLQARLGDDFRVILGMTYGSPSIRDAVHTLENEGITRIVVLSMFPQYSSTTTAPIYDSVYAAAAGRRGMIGYENKRFVPTLRFVEPYYDHPGYIQAMKRHIDQQVNELDQPPDKFVITFHGIPKRYTLTGDPYRQQCEKTAALLAAAMGWTPDDWTLSFQSQFGREEWLQPYTEDVLTGLHAQGVERPFVFSPGFVTDCLETLDELGHEGRDQFEHGGGHGDSFYLAPCLNDSPVWLDVLANLVRENSSGWVTRQPDDEIARIDLM